MFNIIDYVLKKCYPSKKAAWHSWDATPWQHPWLTPSNLEAFGEFSKALRRQLIAELEPADIEKYQFAFVGNVANCMYVRATILRQKGYRADLFLHPQEYYVMSHPAWEEYDGFLTSDDSLNYFDLFKANKLNPHTVSNVHQIPSLEFTPSRRYCAQHNIKKSMYFKYSNYMSQLPTVKRLWEYDALICTQSFHLGYFSNKPYAVVSYGGDLWFEASRADELGQLQRNTYGSANMILVSDPLTLAHCRRYGFHNAMYIPNYIDEHKYSPGHSSLRAEWKNQVGGDFFILTSARLDKEVKGSDMALEASIRCLQRYPNARLALVGWGNHKEELLALLQAHNVVDKVVLLPISGKTRLVDYLRSADCFLGQYILGAYGHADLEALACGLPTISYVEDRYYDHLCETSSPPVLKAQTTLEIEQHLINLQDSDLRREVGERSRTWFINNHGSEKLYLDHLAVLVALAKGKKFNFKPSVLNTSLSSIERDYHYQNLLSAPPFPQYRMGQL